MGRRFVGARGVSWLAAVEAGGAGAELASSGGQGNAGLEESVCERHGRCRSGYGDDAGGTFAGCAALAWGLLQGRSISLDLKHFLAYFHNTSQDV